METRQGVRPQPWLRSRLPVRTRSESGFPHLRLPAAPAEAGWVRDAGTEHTTCGVTPNSATEKAQHLDQSRPRPGFPRSPFIRRDFHANAGLLGTPPTRRGPVQHAEESPAPKGDLCPAGNHRAPLPGWPEPERATETVSPGHGRACVPTSGRRTLTALYLLRSARITRLLAVLTKARTLCPADRPSTGPSLLSPRPGGASPGRANGGGLCGHQSPLGPQLTCPPGLRGPHPARQRTHVLLGSPGASSGSSYLLPSCPTEFPTSWVLSPMRAGMWDFPSRPSPSTRHVTSTRLLN